MKQHIESWKAQTPYPVEFLHNGTRWAITLYAIDDEDAEAKVRSMKESARLVGGAITQVIYCDDTNRP